MQTKRFRISSALKNIIGKDLITSDFIAVFELVKNAFDAHASKVDVSFFNLSSANPTLIIQDNGKGMNLADLEDKWLFVAYSAKREGTEDYRDSIKSTRIHAGAKGIGRFSCDRLGKLLKIYSRKSTDKEFTNFLAVRWEDFEKDSNKKFDEIDVEYDEIDENPYEIKTGTVLEINHLRERWDREKLLRLKRSLEKLINPNQDNDSSNFEINLYAPEYLEQDKLVEKSRQWEVVNGPIKNFLFENLGLKTTFINVMIPQDGSYVHTTLVDRGTLIFELKELNTFGYDDFKLSGVEVSLFALNRSAKSHFTRYMGTPLVNFGSVFLYKNGFRVHPIGEVGDDSFGLDSRKTQGTSRYLGTRDVLGRIEINGTNNQFQEASSRDGGLVRNQAYDCLKNFFITNCLKRLERYAVDIVKYGNLGDDFDSAIVQQSDLKSQVLSLVQSLTKSDVVIDVNYDPKVIDLLNELSEQSLQNVLRNFKSIAQKSSNPTLEKEAHKAEVRLRQLAKARQEAEEEAEEAKALQKKAEEAARLEQEKAREARLEAEQANVAEEKRTTENLFLRSMINTDVTNVVSLHHHIGISAQTIENYIKNMTTQIKSGQPFSEDTVIDVLEKISLQAKKILTTTRFATKANFNLEGAKVEEDLCGYIEEYLLNVCTGIVKTLRKENMKFVWGNPDDVAFLLKFRPLEISIILDNLISNSAKAGASTITLEVLNSSGKSIDLLFSDDGKKQIPQKMVERIFDVGYTTTDGSGLGLHQTRKLIRDMKGDIELIPSEGVSGVSFRLKFKK